MSPVDALRFGLLAGFLLGVPAGAAWFAWHAITLEKRREAKP